jgi:hypothetical protein
MGLCLMLIVLTGTSGGCQTLWVKVRENEREYAVDSARAYSRRGACTELFESVDRASARLDIGRFAVEAIQMRIRCYEKLGRVDAARAHQRLLEDFYGDENEQPAYPRADGTSVFRVANVPDLPFENPPSALELGPPTYSIYARRSDIVGRVVVAFELSPNNRPRNIRVLEMPHPLLASWAIEAVEKITKKKKATGAVIAPGGHYITTYSFEYRWAENVETDGSKALSDPEDE